MGVRTAVLAALAGMACTAAAYPPYVRVVPALPRIPAGRHTVVLTFDDGPDPTWTPKVLRLLAEHHVHGVFCQVGRRVQQHPELVREVVAGGNLLCDHTWDHPLTIGSMSVREVTGELRRTAKAQTRAARATGQRLDDAPTPRFFRIPYDHWSAHTDKAGRQLHLIALGWNDDPQDWSRPGAKVILSRELKALKTGSIVLNHDGGGDRAQTVASLARLLDWLDAHHWRVVLPEAG